MNKLGAMMADIFSGAKIKTFYSFRSHQEISK
jgi:hypothetical protein